VAVSTVPALKAALLNALEALPSLSGVKVSWGWDGPAPELILLGDVPVAEQEPAAMRAGPHTRAETYTLDVLIRVERRTKNQRAVTERAYELAGVIEALLREDYTVGGVVRIAQFASGALEEQAGDDIRVALLTVGVLCTARI
jgi:hypothetical protein